MWRTSITGPLCGTADSQGCTTVSNLFHVIKIIYCASGRLNMLSKFYVVEFLTFNQRYMHNLKCSLFHLMSKSFTIWTYFCRWLVLYSWRKNRFHGIYKIYTIKFFITCRMITFLQEINSRKPFSPNNRISLKFLPY